MLLNYNRDYYKPAAVSVFGKSQYMISDLRKSRVLTAVFFCRFCSSRRIPFGRTCQSLLPKRLHLDESRRFFLPLLWFLMRSCFYKKRKYEKRLFSPSPACNTCWTGHGIIFLGTMLFICKQKRKNLSFPRGFVFQK